MPSDSDFRYEIRRLERRIAALEAGRQKKPTQWLGEPGIVLAQCKTIEELTDFAAKMVRAARGHQSQGRVCREPGCLHCERLYAALNSLPDSVVVRLKEGGT